jgi:flagellar biosynthesis protein FlhG
MRESRSASDQASRLREIAARSLVLAPPASPYVITVTSGKGGVGKSTVALNLAIHLGGLGTRVLLVDADANLANLDVMLGIAPEFRLGHVLRGDRDIEDVLVEPFPGLRLLPGSSGEAGYPAASAGRQREFMADLIAMEDRSDYIVIDTSAGLTPEVIGFATSANETVVVTTPEPTAIVDAYATIKAIRMAKEDEPIGVVMNAVRVPAEGDDAAAKLAVAVRTFLRSSFTYLGMIPYDQHVTSAVARSRAVAREFPTSGASLSMHAIARHFLRSAQVKEGA